MMTDEPKSRWFQSGIYCSALVVPVAAVFALIVPVAALAQARTFAEDGIEFTLELPSPTWRWVVEPIGSRKRVEFINGDDCLSGCLNVRKMPHPPAVMGTNIAAAPLAGVHAA